MTEWTIYLNGTEALNAEILRLTHQVWDMKQITLTLNREIASKSSEIDKLNERIAMFRKAGDYIPEPEPTRDPDHPYGYLLDKMTRQRKEIAILHRIIKELKGQSSA